jgi:SARP family transcriptional regulator, regulator of embCAB operon
VRYEILRPMCVVDSTGSYSLSARKAEIMLATLLIKADQVVSIDQLVAELWPNRAPRRAIAAIHVYASQLRKFLERPNRANSPIITRSPGYLLHLDGDDETDLAEFESYMTAARGLVRGRDHEQAVTWLKAALDLWAGPPLDELREGPTVSVFAAWLEEIKLECLEMYAQSNLALCRYRELIPLLYSLIRDYPLHEAFYEQLMVALHGSGRRADALKLYQYVYDTLRAELRIEPCHSLKELRTRLLADELDLVRPESH